MSLDRGPFFALGLWEWLARSALMAAKTSPRVAGGSSFLAPGEDFVKGPAFPAVFLALTAEIFALDASLILPL